MAEARKPVLPAATREQAERLHVFAHDIKNRLGGLWEMLRMLRAPENEGMERDELFAFAERSYFNAQHDVEALLDDFAVDRGITVDEPAPFNLTDCVNEACSSEAYRTGKKEQRVTILVPPGTTAVGDARWTAQILQALISNASKFSPRGSVIEVAVTTKDHTVSATVQDHGVGLSAEDLSQLFTRYAQLGSRSTEGEPQARGTIARARQWAEAQGGTLYATSAGEGKGSVFTLTLPSA